MILLNDGMNEIYRFPGAYVWQRKLPNHEEIKARVLPKIIEEANEHADDPHYKWDDTVPSTVVTNFENGRSDPFDIFSCEDIRDISFKSAQDFIDSGDLPGACFAPQYVLKAFWWNRYLRGSTAPAHIHSGGISGVYLLEQTERCPLEFLDLNMHSPDHERPSTHYWPEVEEGTVLLFPGTLTHWVRPTAEPRTTVSFNLARAPD